MVHNQDIHVLMVTLFYYGHINPLLRFAKLLTSKGIHVTLATTSHARDQLLNGLGKQNNFIDFEFFDDGLDDELDRDMNVGILLEKYLPRDGLKNLSNLIYTLEGKGKKFECIIANCFVPWVTNVATTHNIPCAMLWVQCCATYAIFYHLYHQKLSNMTSLLDDPNHVFKIPGLPLLKVEDLPTFIFPSTPPHFLNVIMTTISLLDRFQWIFGSSFCEIEESLVHSMMQYKPILPIGPLVSPFMLDVGEAQEDADENDLCLDWLNKQGASSVIYIALGSLSELSQSETEALAMALESDSNRRFLWVRKQIEKNIWRKETGELPKDFLRKTKDRGLIVPWCRQDKVLMHPSIQCFLTHCGWNSTLEAISAGVPVIAYPDWTDQPTNAKLLVDVFKVGVRMKKRKDGELEKEEIERCIVEVTKGPRALAMKEQASKWKVAAKKATSSSGSSNMNIEKFINYIRGRLV